jgi:arylsulfatase A-like enzyme
VPTLCVDRGRRRRRAAALTLLAAALAGCAPAPPPAAPPPPNVVVVLVDTLRADRLPLYGYRRDTAPELTRFARERAVVFRQAWANAGCTFPSANSLLTGLWPQRFLIAQKTHGMAIPPEVPTLAGRLAARGWATAAVSASLIVRATPSTLNHVGGFAAGFDRFDEQCYEAPAACVNARALALARDLPEPFFLYLHYLDPHQPYRPPAEHLPVFTATRPAPTRRWVREGDPFPLLGTLYGRGGARFDGADVRYLSDLYDEEIRYLDGRLGELFRGLEAGGRLGRTIVVFLADHGEELYDHGDWGHCRDLAHPTILHTPLWFAVPGTPPAARDELVSNIDLVPTLLDLVGVPYAPAELDGRSLRPLLEPGGTLPARPLFAAQGVLRVARDRARMLRLDLRARRAESVPLAAPAAGEAGAGALRRALLDWIRGQEGALGEGEMVRRAEALEGELRALGYL